MVARRLRLRRVSALIRLSILVGVVAPGAGCISTTEVKEIVSWNRPAGEPPRLPEVEQMIDDLDRVMTAYGTISVKTPDVWGQDRLTKFRSEYESQMGAWLKLSFKGDINAT